MLLFATLAVLLQPDTVRLTERLCASCNVRLERIATLGDNNGPGAISTFRVALAKDTAGRYLVSEGAPLSVYSAQGTFLRTVGRRGGGPGEYRRIWRIAPFSQGTIIFDDFAKRSTVLSLNFKVIDTKPAPEAPLSVIVRDDRSGVMASFVNTPALKGVPLHDFDTQGVLVRSYGASRTPYRADLRDLFQRYVAKSTVSNTFWINHRRDYTFAHCTFGNQSCRTYVRRAEWFPAPAFSGLVRAPAPGSAAATIDERVAS